MGAVCMRRSRSSVLLLCSRRPPSVGLAGARSLRAIRGQSDGRAPRRWPRIGVAGFGERV